jgi:hypothetical protein
MMGWAARGEQVREQLLTRARALNAARTTWRSDEVIENAAVMDALYRLPGELSLADSSDDNVRTYCSDPGSKCSDPAPSQDKLQEVFDTAVKFAKAFNKDSENVLEKVLSQDDYIEWKGTGFPPDPVEAVIAGVKAQTQDVCKRHQKHDCFDCQYKNDPFPAQTQNVDACEHGAKVGKCALCYLDAAKQVHSGQAQNADAGFLEPPFNAQKHREWRDWFRRRLDGNRISPHQLPGDYNFMGLEDDVLEKLQEVFHAQQDDRSGGKK